MFHFEKKTLAAKSIIVLSMVLLNGGILLDAFVVSKTYQTDYPIDGSTTYESVRLLLSMMFGLISFGICVATYCAVE
jgi:hypothetical protein